MKTQTASVTIVCTTSVSAGRTKTGSACFRSAISSGLFWILALLAFAGHLAGQTNRTLTLTNLKTADAGRYSVVVSMAGGVFQTNYTYLTTDPQFTKVTNAPWTTDLGNSSGAIGDYNDDGYLDLFISRYRAGRSALYHNNGDGSLSVTELAKSVPNPERVVGIHFFNPVHRMPLVEIITHAGNTPDVIATAPNVPAIFPTIFGLPSVLTSNTLKPQTPPVATENRPSVPTPALPNPL